MTQKFILQIMICFSVSKSDRIETFASQSTNGCFVMESQLAEQITATTFAEHQRPNVTRRQVPQKKRENLLFFNKNFHATLYQFTDTNLKCVCSWCRRKFIPRPPFHRNSEVRFHVSYALESLFLLWIFDWNESKIPFLGKM